MCHSLTSSSYAVYSFPSSLVCSSYSSYLSSLFPPLYSDILLLLFLLAQLIPSSHFLHGEAGGKPTSQINAGKQTISVYRKGSLVCRMA